MNEEFDKWFALIKDTFPSADKNIAELAFFAGYVKGHVAGQNFAVKTINEFAEIWGKK